LRRDGGGLRHAPAAALRIARIQMAQRDACEAAAAH